MWGYISPPWDQEDGVSPSRTPAQIDRQTYYTAQVATEADYRYVRKIGSAAQANRLILSILNKA